MRSAGSKRGGSGFWVASVAAGLLCVTGCDNSQNEADKQTRADLVEAQEKNSQGQTAAADAKLKSAAQNAAASAGLRANAKASLAQAEFQAGQDIVGKINKSEMDLSRVAFEVGQLANQIRLSGGEVVASRQYDPKPAKDAINAAIADAQGGPDKPAWFTQGNAVLPTQTAVKEQIAKIQADLSQKQDQVKNLTQQRGVLIDQAEQATIQVDQLKGDRALEVFKRASDLRRQAGEISVQIDTLQNEIAKVQNSLSVAQAQQAAVNDAITQLKDQIATLDKAWQEVDAKASEHQKLAAQILGTPGASAGTGSSAGGSIAQKAAEWSRLTKEIRQLRTEAEARLGNAARYFDEARKAADELRRDLADKIGDPKNAGRSEVATWENAKLAMDPAQFRLQFATAQRALGELYLSEAASAAQRASVVSSLQATLEGTSLRVPADLLGGDPNAERNNALKSADAALRESDESLDNIDNGVSDIKVIKDTAKVARALTLYDWAQVARQMGNEKVAKERLTAATQARNSAAENNAVIPAMPPELGPLPKPAAPGSAEPAADAGSAVNPNDSPDQAAVRAVLKTFSDALTKGDLEAAKASLQIAPGQEEAVTQVLELPVIFQKFDAAMKAKFGEQALQQKDEKGNGFKFTSTPTSAADVGKVKIDINGDVAILDGKNEPMSRVTKVNGQWKLQFDGPKTDEERKQLEALIKVTASLKTVTSEVEAGKYAKAEDAAGAFMGAFMQGLMAGAMPTTAPATGAQ